MAGRFGEWRVDKDRTLRGGGQGDIFVVSRPSEAQLRVLKRLRNRNRQARFEREIETMRSLLRSGVPVPPVVAEGITTGRDARPYYVMPFYEHGSLEAAVDERRFAGSHADGIDLLRAVARGLAALHANNCAHRDVKPANVLLQDDEQPLLADLGLALTVEELRDELRLTESAEAVGSRLYIAPENESGFNLDVDQRPADCYAFAKLAWALLAGQDPPAREHQLEPQRRLATVTGVSELARLDSLFERLLVVDPRARLSDWAIVDRELAATTLAILGETDSFDFWLLVLERYVETNRTAATAPATTYEGLALGRWCAKQRTLHGRGRLSVEHAGRLEALRGWQWDSDEAIWERMFSLLEKYLEREKHLIVPREHVEDGEPLGKWVRRQRGVYKGHTGGLLNDRRIAKLVALPGWTWDRQDDKWERAFAALRSFVDREGHANVPRGHVENGVYLYAWVMRQQDHYKMGRLQRQGDRLARLEAMDGWKWWLRVADRWERNFAALVKFWEREGYLQPPEGHWEDGVSLWRWVRYQRGRYAEGKLQAHPDHVARLEALPGWKWSNVRGRSTAAAPKA
jgi:hypothetical protein